MLSPIIKQRPLITHPENFQGVPPVVAHVLARRSIQSVSDLELKLKRLLQPNFKGLNEAIHLMDQAIDQHQKVIIVGDYDADGATSTALMVLVLKALDVNVHYVVPDRFKYGYGLTAKIADLVYTTYQPDLLITVDNGISSHDGVSQAQKYGMKVMITDHHLTTKEAPSAEAVVNPNQLGCCFESKAIAGVGVAFYVLAALMSDRKKNNKSTVSLTQYLDLVALGTYADVAALDHNNRILIQTGVELIQKQTCRPGILALLDVAGREANTIQASDLGFILGPRLNAAGRMDHMQVGVECLLADDPQVAYSYALQLQAFNVARRRVETDIKDEALKDLNQIHLDQNNLPAALVLYEPHWHQGVIGIVAGRLKEQFHRPSIVFAPDEDGLHIKGSARSVDGIHIRDLIEDVAQEYPHLVRFFGGHAAAAGLTILKEHFVAFKTVVEQKIAALDPNLLQATLWTDGSLAAIDMNLNTVQQIALYGPWGQKFPSPVFEGVFDIAHAKWLKDQHLKLTLKLENVQKIDAIAFHAKERFMFDEQQSKVYLVYELDKNSFNGRTQPQLKVLYLKSV